jgi:hypothetical protein
VQANGTNPASLMQVIRRKVTLRPSIDREVLILNTVSQEGSSAYNPARIAVAEVAI